MPVRPRKRNKAKAAQRATERRARAAAEARQQASNEDVESTAQKTTKKTNKVKAKKLTNTFAEEQSWSVSDGVQSADTDDSLDWGSVNPSMEERVSWDEGGFVGCEVLSGKNYVVETKNGATIIKKKKKKKSSKKNTGTKSNTKSTESVPPTKKKRRNSNSSRSSDDGWDGDAEAEVWSNSSPPSSTARSDAQDVDIEVRDTTSAMEGLPWQKLNPTFEERVGWDEGGFIGCEVLSGKDHLVEKTKDGTGVRIIGKARKSAASKSQTADSAEKTESNNKKKKNDKSKANAVVAKQGKAESGKTKAEDKNKQQKTKRVIDEVIKAAVLNELTERKGGSKPKPYKLIRDEVTKSLGRSLDNFERQFISEGLQGALDPVEARKLAEAKKAAKKARKLELKKQRQREKKKANQDKSSLVPTRSNASISVDQLSDGWKQLLLHPTILGNLARLGFKQPTPIQSLCIPAAVRHFRDVVGAAQTGSGKTLAFSIPIVHSLLGIYDSKRRSSPTKRKQTSAKRTPSKRSSRGKRKLQSTSNSDKDGDADDEHESAAESDGVVDSTFIAEEHRVGLYALIVSPTRELSMQIKAHIAEMLEGTRVNVVAIVGGMSKQKQQRLLRRRPEIVVGTPGRLWDLFAHQEEHFKSMHATLKFMVLDEFDRMVTPGAYPELSQLCKAVYADTALVATADGAAVFAGAPIFDSDGNVIGREGEETDGTGAQVDESKPAIQEPSRKQTFLFSATLNIDLEGRERIWNKGKPNPLAAVTAKAMKRKKRLEKLKGEAEKEAALLGKKLSILEHIPRVGIEIRPKPAIFDLSKAKPPADITGVSGEEGADASTNEQDSTLSLPSTLSIQQVSCADDQKIAFLHFFLDMHRTGRTLIFVNSISLVKQLTQLLSLLRVAAIPLHANMQQRQRLKNLDRLRRNEKCVVVATDVAARGLDVPKVEHVIHYHVPRSAEIFVHRSGRTARAAAKGHCLVLLAPQEQKLYSRICGVLGYANGFLGMPLELSKMSPHFTRAALATKIVKQGIEADRAHSQLAWFEKCAADMDIDLDDSMLQQLRKGKDYEHDPQSAENVSRKQRQKLASMRARLKMLLDEGERQKAAEKDAEEKLNEAGATTTLGASVIVS